MNDSVKTSVCVNLAAYVEKQAKRFSSNLEKVLASGDVHGVHDVRVASRRLAVPLRLMGSWLGGKPTKRPSCLLRTTRQSLREVRDLDVLMESLNGEPSSDCRRLEAKDLARLEGALTRRRQRRIRKALRTIARAKANRATGLIWRLSDKMLDVVGEENDLILAHQVEQLFDRSLERLAKRDPRGEEVHDLHETRICVKRLRYAGELMRDVGLRQESELLRELVSMQDLLGHWNDRLTAVGYITREARRPEVLAQDAGWSSRMLDFSAGLAAEADVGRARILSAWVQLDQILKSFIDRPIAGDTSAPTHSALRIG